jgi:hypothetical protein
MPLVNGDIDWLWVLSRSAKVFNGGAFHFKGRFDPKGRACAGRGAPPKNPKNLGLVVVRENHTNPSQAL